MITDIDIRYDLALADAKRLASCASQLEMLAKKYENAMSELMEYWDGPCQRSYTAVAEERIMKIRHTAEHMQSISNAITRTAQVYKMSEIAKNA